MPDWNTSTINVASARSRGSKGSTPCSRKYGVNPVTPASGYPISKHGDVDVFMPILDLSFPYFRTGLDNGLPEDKMSMLNSFGSMLVIR